MLEAIDRVTSNVQAEVEAAIQKDIIHGVWRGIRQPWLLPWKLMLSQLRMAVVILSSAAVWLVLIPCF